MTTTAQVRAIIERIGKLPTINIASGADDSWMTAGFGLGPFPARLVLDDAAQEVRGEVALVDFPSASIEEAMQGIPYPSPEVIIRLEPGAAPILAYRMPYAEATEDEAIGLVSACAMYTVALTGAMWDELPSQRRRMLNGKVFRRGVFDSGGALRTGDPRDLLRTDALPFPASRSSDTVPSPAPASRADAARAKRGARVRRKVAIPDGHRCDDVDDLHGLLQWWIANTTESRISGSGAPGTHHIRVQVGGTEVAMGGATTREAVQAFLDIAAEDGAVFLSTVLAGATVARGIRVGSGQYPMDEDFFLEIVGDPGLPRWLTDPPREFRAAVAAQRHPHGRALMMMAGHAWPGKVGVCQVDGWAIQNARTTAVIAEVSGREARIVVRRAVAGQARRHRAWVVAVEQVNPNGLADVVVDLDAVGNDFNVLATLVDKAVAESERIAGNRLLALRADPKTRPAASPPSAQSPNPAPNARAGLSRGADASQVQRVAAELRAAISAGAVGTVQAGRGYIQWQGVVGEGLFVEAGDGEPYEIPFRRDIANALIEIGWRRPVPADDLRNSWFELPWSADEPEHRYVARLEAAAEQIIRAMEVLERMT